MPKQLQHYVPKFLLKQFATNSKGQIHVFDKHTGNAFETNITQLAAINRFYDFDFMDTPMTIEPGLAELESDAANHFKRIRESQKLNLDCPMERGILARFLAVQMVRTPAIEKTYSDVFLGMEKWLRENGMGEDFFQPDPKLGEGANIEKAMRARRIVNAPKDFGAAFVEKDWVLLKTNANAPYLIGDHPLTMHNMLDHGDLSPRMGAVQK